MSYLCLLLVSREQSLHGVNYLAINVNFIAMQHYRRLLSISFSKDYKTTLPFLASSSEFQSCFGLDWALATTPKRQVGSMTRNAPIRAIHITTKYDKLQTSKSIQSAESYMKYNRPLMQFLCEDRFLSNSGISIRQVQSC